MTITTEDPGVPAESAAKRTPLLYSVADPAPLGLAAFAMTTLALSLSNSNVWPAGVYPALALALVYGGTGQLLAGMWEFARKNTFGAIAFTSYGAFWISFYVLNKFVAPGIPAADVASAVGVFLLGWTILTFYLMIAAMRVSGAVLAVFVALDITFVFLTIGAFQSNMTCNHIGGYVGLVTAALAFYASGAGVINDTFKKPILPTFPLAKG